MGSMETSGNAHLNGSSESSLRKQPESDAALSDELYSSTHGERSPKQSRMLYSLNLSTSFICTGSLLSITERVSEGRVS